MILGARESRDHQLARALKIIKNLRLVFAGDDSEKICFQIIDDIPLVLQHFGTPFAHEIVSSKNNKTILNDSRGTATRPNQATCTRVSVMEFPISASAFTVINVNH